MLFFFAESSFGNKQILKDKHKECISSKQVLGLQGIDYLQLSHTPKFLCYIVKCNIQLFNFKQLFLIQKAYVQ